jgi:hypothetical protein
MERLDAWRSSQEAVDVHEFAGLLDPATLEGRSGREVAAAIVAAQPSPPDREPDGGLTSLELAGADVPFERALVDLAERIRDLPA